MNPSRVFSLTATLFGVLTVAFIACIGFSVGGEWFSNAIDDLGELVAALVAAGACAVASRRTGRDRAGWTFMAWSSFSWACGEAIWSYFDLIRGVELPSPSAADVGFLAAVPLAVVGLHKLSPLRPSRGSQRGGLAGGILLGCGVLAVVGALTLLRDPRGSELLQRVVGLAYPLGDLVMAAVVLSAVRRGTGNRTTMHLVLAGIVAFTVADTWFAAVVTVGDFGLPYWLDSGWVLGYFLVALGAMWPPDATRTAPQSRRVAGRASGTRYSAGAAAVATLTTAPISRPASTTTYWLARANADHIVNYAALFLIVVDASVVLYDLGSILHMLA